MSSRWTHNACAGCFMRFYPGRKPYSLVNPPLESCCFCGVGNIDGIYVRHDPNDADLACQGKHVAEVHA